VDFQQVVQRRRMVRRYDVNRPVPAEVIDRIVHNGLRASLMMLLTAVDAGLGACFFGVRSRRKPQDETVYRGRWNQPASREHGSHG
jgi:hypothetical protein